MLPLKCQVKTSLRAELWLTQRAGKEFRRKEGPTTVRARVWSMAVLKTWNSTGIKGWTRGGVGVGGGGFYLKRYKERCMVEWKQK